MTLKEAAKKWDISTNWLRELIKSKRVRFSINSTGPISYYEIPDDEPKPLSMTRAPFRKGTEGGITEEAVKRRISRDEETKRMAKAVAAKKKAAVKSA